MVNRANTPANPLKGRSLLTALVFALLIHVQMLAGQGTLQLLSPERRIVLLIIAVRLLSMIRPSLTEAETAEAVSKPRYAGWQAGVLPFSFVTPLLVVVWAVWWSTGGLLPHITSYAIGTIIIMVLLVANLLFVLAKVMRGAADSVQYNENFWTDFLFYGVYGFVFGLGMVGLMVLSPESLDDIKVIGQITFSLYILLWVVQVVFAWFDPNRVSEYRGQFRNESFETRPGQQT